jgi:beta-N-acetylhexosaminidase
VRRAAAVLAGVAVLVAGAGCGGGGGDEAARPGAGDAAGTDADEQRCDGATVEQRAAAVVVAGLPGVTTADHPVVDRMAATGVGGVMLRDENLLDATQATDLVAGLRARLGEDLLVAVDEEGGRVTSLRALGDDTPSARRLGREGPEAARREGAELGALLRSLGIDWIFAPVLDRDDGPAAGLIGDRSFGSDPSLVTATASAFAAGVRAEGVAVTLKHFPGSLGAGDPHVGASTSDVTLQELERSDLPPFRAMVGEGAEAVMVGHVAYPRLWGELPASLEPQAYALLRSMGFEGVAITDALGMGTVHSRWGFDVAAPMALAAGADAVLVNQGDRYAELIRGIVAAVATGELAEARLDEAAARVLDLHGRDGDLVICSQR